MKQSIAKLALFSILPLFFIAISIYKLEEGTADFYTRFTSPQQNSLILGSSRAASLDPELIEKATSIMYPSAKLYNYAFTWAHSPFGPKYLESIEKKVIPNSKNGLFIICVEPSSLMVDNNQPDDERFYIENDKSVAKTSCVTCNPNFEYLLESYEYSITHALNSSIFPEKNQIQNNRITKNGRMEVKNVKQISEKIRKEWNEKGMKEFDSRLGGLKLSQKRLAYLEKTIDFLQNHGRVFLVRMPISTTPLEIENRHLKSFNFIIQKIAEKKKIKYIDFNSYDNSFEWTDEVHLTPESMFDFSKTLGDSIVTRD